MKILVTGGSGFIGSFIVDQLSKDKNNQIQIFDIAAPNFKIKDNVRYIDGDICYKTAIDKAITDCEEVYDCAGVLGTSELVFQTERAIDTNIKGAFNVIQSCLDNKVKRIFHPTKPFFKTYWENTYTISKITAENFARMYRDVYDMDLTILRWLNASGPRQHLFPVRKFIPLAICDALLDRDIEIYGTGEQTIDIIDVRDIANIAIISTRNGVGKDKKVYDVGAGQALTCNYVAEKIIKMTNSKSKIKYLPMRVGEALNTKIVAVNHEELFKKFNLKLNFSYEQTLQDSIEFYKLLGRDYLIKSSNYFKV